MPWPFLRAAMLPEVCVPWLSRSSNQLYLQAWTVPSARTAPGVHPDVVAAQQVQAQQRQQGQQQSGRTSAIT
jgi:hypothetical protein